MSSQLGGFKLKLKLPGAKARPIGEPLPIPNATANVSSQLRVPVKKRKLDHEESPSQPQPGVESWRPDNSTGRHTGGSLPTDVRSSQGKLIKDEKPTTSSPWTFQNGHSSQKREAGKFSSNLSSKSNAGGVGVKKERVVNGTTGDVARALSFEKYSPPKGSGLVVPLKRQLKFKGAGTLSFGGVSDLPPPQVSSQGPKPEDRPPRSKRARTTKPIDDDDDDDELFLELGEDVPYSGFKEDSSQRKSESTLPASSAPLGQITPSSKLGSRRKLEENPEGGPSANAMEKILDKIQKKDVDNIFRDPVTEAIAPGYFTLISKPMDFTTMRRKLAAGEYSSWDVLEEDIRTMFTNAMTYNTEDTIYHKEAKQLLEISLKLLDLGRQGVTNFRGRTAGIVRAHNAKLAAEAREEQERLKAAIRSERAQAKSGRVANKTAAGGLRQAPTIKAGSQPTSEQGAGAVEEEGGDVASNVVKNRSNYRIPKFVDDGRGDENHRQSYKPLVGRGHHLSSLGALLNGSTPEGLPYSVGRPVLKPYLIAQVPEPMAAYLNSASRFVERCGPQVQAIVLRRLSCIIPNQDLPAAPSTVGVTQQSAVAQSSLPLNTSTPQPSPVTMPSPEVVFVREGPISGGRHPPAPPASVPSPLAAPLPMFHPPNLASNTSVTPPSSNTPSFSLAPDVVTRGQPVVVSGGHQVMAGT